MSQPTTYFKYPTVFSPAKLTSPMARFISEPSIPLADVLKNTVTEWFTIVGAVAPGALVAASVEGQKFARLIGEPDAPTTFHEAFWPDAPYENMPQPAAVLLGPYELTAFQSDLITAGERAATD